MAQQYRLDPEKVKTMKDLRVILDAFCLISADDSPDWDRLKDYFTRPYTPQPLTLTEAVEQ